MLAKLLSTAFGAKATALSGLLIVASALLTAGGPDAVVPVVDEPDPSPAVIGPAGPAPTPLATAAPEPARKTEPTSTPTPAAAPPCASDAQAQREAVAAIRTAYAAAQAALDRLGSERTSSGAADALDRADAMLANVDRTAEDLAARSGACAADVREVSARAMHAMEMIVDLAKSATAPTPTPTPATKHERKRR